MENKRRIGSIFLSAFGMVLLILDSKTAIQGAAEGVNLCISSVIPSLFPYFILSILLTNSLLNSGHWDGVGNGSFRNMRKPGTALFIAGLLGGYPAGAQSVAEAYYNGYLNKKTAHRLLGFCSNAGPAFIFGFTSRLFSAACIPWVLWGIHILSALAVSFLIPGSNEDNERSIPGAAITIQQAFTKSLHAIASVCGWIILFRVIIAFLGRWFLWLLPCSVGVFISGLLELANGIILLQNVNSEAARFICCSILLAFGGCCVALQTNSVIKDLGTGWYFPGKLMQCMISGILSVIASKTIYGFQLEKPAQLVFLFTVICFTIFTMIIRKFPIAFLRKSVYNEQKSTRELPLCSFEKR